MLRWATFLVTNAVSENPVDGNASINSSLPFAGPLVIARVTSARGDNTILMAQSFGEQAVFATSRQRGLESGL